MQQSYLRCAVGNWLVNAPDKPEDILEQPEYWSMLAALLAAGQEYGRLHTRQLQERSQIQSNDLAA